MSKKDEKIEEVVEEQPKEESIDEKSIEEKPKEEESAAFSKDDAIALFNELMAEKEEVIIEELSQKMENKIQTIVNGILEQSEPKEDVEDEPKESEEDGEAGETAKALPDLEETSISSKLDQIAIEKSQNDTFLNSEHRDMFGRNKKYL